MTQRAERTVSVAMATFNGGRYIAEQLRSLAAQSLAPHELVVTDDQSTDDTVAQVLAFAQTAPFPVSVTVNPERLGYRRNFMAAADRATAPLVAFCDQDDVWYPHKLALCAEAFEDPDCLLCFHDADVGSDPALRDGPSLLGTQPVGPALAGQYKPWESCNGLTQVFRRALLQHSDLQPRSMDHNKPAEPLAHDQWVFFLAGALGRITCLPERLLFYRQHATNTFGVSGGPTGLRAALTRLATPPQDIVVFAEAARARHAILQEIACRGPADVAVRAGSAARAWGELARFHELRCAVHRSPGRVGAGLRVASTLAAGGYRDGFSARPKLLAAARDLLAVLRGGPGLAPPPLLADAD